MRWTVQRYKLPRLKPLGKQHHQAWFPRSSDKWLKAIYHFTRRKPQPTQSVGVECVMTEMYKNVVNVRAGHFTSRFFVYLRLGRSIPWSCTYFSSTSKFAPPVVDKK